MCSKLNKSVPPLLVPPLPVGAILPHPGKSGASCVDAVYGAAAAQRPLVLQPAHAAQ